MFRRASLGLLLGAIPCALALANCSSGAVEEDAAWSDEDITGANNKMGLGLVYDEASGALRATVRRRLGDGESLRLRVRRGRLSMESQRELSCGDLPEAPALAARDDVAAGKIVYQGPAVDPALLKTVYDARWIDGKITPEMLDALEREGADAIVEACITKGDAVRARLQTSLPYAWDEADPSLAEDVAPQAAGGLHVLARDAGGAPRPPREGRPIHSMEKYAELCVAQLGEIPFFKKLANGKYETFDCAAGKGQSGPIEGVENARIPQTVTAADGTDATPTACNARNINRYDCFDKCDKPEWLFQSCEPGPTVTTAKNEQGTHWVLLCRSAGKRNGNEDVARLSKTKTFNDIAMIGHDPRTGKTCYFQNKIFDGNDGARVPHPADREKSRHVWDGPKGYCMGCHSAEPFIHSPWIDGAKRRDGNPIVPMMGKHPDFEISWNASPYSVVNRKAQGDAMVGDSQWVLPKQIVSEEAEACLTCHRIGGGQGMRRFPMWATGGEGLDTFPSGTSGPLQPKLSDWAKRFENSHWMPLRLQGLTEENFGASKYGKAVAHIKKCAEDASAEGCVFQDIPGR